MGAGKTTFYDAHLKEAFPILVPPISHQREAMLREQTLDERALEEVAFVKFDAIGDEREVAPV